MRNVRFIVLGMILVTLIVGCKPKSVTKTSKNFILLEARLERTHSEKTEVVSKVCFIAESGMPVSTFLPSGGGYGIGIAFIPKIITEDKIVLSRANYTNKFYAEDILGDYKAFSSEYPFQNANKITLKINKGEDKGFVKGGMSKAGNKVSYRVFFNFDRTAEFTDLKHLGSSLVELNGERLHQINNAIPEIMSVGVEYGDMIDKKFNQVNEKASPTKSSKNN